VATPSQAEYRAAVFQAEVTVPLGHALMGGGIAAASEVVTPLYAKGVVLLGPEAPIVFLAIDWCEIRNDAYDRWREVLAETAGTVRERVLLASIHQHDTPVADLTAQRLLDEHGLDRALCDGAFHEDCVQRTAAALREALSNARRVTHYGLGAARVEEVASNRRVEWADGTVAFSRNSATADPEVRAAPVGEIDPWLRTLSLWDGGEPVAALHSYSVHPMSYYGKGGVGYDFVGMARERRQADAPGVFHVYFSGASGDTTAGKYNDGAPENRAVLADKVYRAMVAAWDATERHALRNVAFRNAAVHLSPPTAGPYAPGVLEQTLADASATVFNRNLAAMGLSWRRRVESGQVIDVPLVDFGHGQFMVLPGEAFVGFQLAAQRLRPGVLTLVAGYGECAPGYVPTAQPEAEGFLEHHGTWSWVAPGSHQAVLDAIAEVVSAGEAQSATE